MVTFKEVMKSFVDNLPRPPSKEERKKNANSPNIFKVIFAPSPIQALMFFSAWWAWTMDAYDFFSVSLVVVRLEDQFPGKDSHDITMAVTLTLLFRSLGALIFGLISDRYGRKWPLVANLLIVAVLELGSGFVNTFPQFLAVRSLFGIGMGGIWGLSASTGLESMPVQSRGFYSGVLQQGYAVGYLIAAVVNLTLVENTDNWRNLFFVGAGLSFGCAIFRVLLPETEYFQALQAARTQTESRSSVFIREIGVALKTYWARCLFAVFLMTGMNFFSHGSQDLYPTYLQEAKLISSHNASIATIIGNCGAIAGGTIAGSVSQYLGRRLTIIVCCLWTACFIPLWILPNSFGPLAAGAFFVQSGVQGAWGVIPIYLQEISPPNMRAVWPGVAYQLGNMVSSASSQIIATAGNHLKKYYRGRLLPDYETIQGIFIGVIAAWIILWCILGREYHSATFTEGTAIERQERDEQDAVGASDGQIHRPESPIDKLSKIDDVEAHPVK